MLRVNCVPLLYRSFHADLNNSNLAPGAYLEMQDTDFPPRSDDGSLLKSSALMQWADKITEACKIAGREVRVCDYKQWMIEAGFEEVTEVVRKWPQNLWPKDPKMKRLGKWNLANTLDGLQAYSLGPLTRFMGMTSDEVELMLVDVRKDMKNKEIRAYWPV